MGGKDVLELETPQGPARAHLQPVEDPRAASCSATARAAASSAPDLVAASAAARAAGVTVALVEQPYRVAGRRSPAPAARLDAAWVAVVEQLRDGPLGGLPLISGGRSSGARVACRTAAATGAAGVLCLAFPLVPPGRHGRASAARARRRDRARARRPGRARPFGMPAPGARRTVVEVAGDHRLRSDVGAVGAAVEDWLSGLLVRG